MSSYYERKNREKMKFRISFVFLFIIASFAACFALYMKGVQLPEGVKGEVIEIETAEGQTEENEVRSTADKNPVALCDRVPYSYFDSCMFAGDSLIVGLSAYGIMPEDRVAANIGMSVMSINSTPLTDAEGNEMLAADRINNAAPENLYVLLGLNMLGAYTDEQMLAAYGDFIDSIDREKVKNIYVISVPPVTGERETDEEKPILNSDIDRFNSDLLKFAGNRCIYYVDLNTEFKGTDGRFPQEYAEADGIHFKKSTYSLMLDYLLTHVVAE